MPTSNTHAFLKDSSLTGGLSLTWILCDNPRTITTKTGDRRTLVELRDPRRLSNSIVIWLDGDAEGLSPVTPGTPVTVLVESVRSRSREQLRELVGNATREAVEAAFALALEQSS
jgi:hypothetical protein